MKKRDWRPSPAEFEKIVEEALDELPEEIGDLLENIVVVIEEEPSRDDRDGMGDEELLGIYRGVPRTERSFEELPMLPDQIAIFRRPILRCCSSREEAVAEIRDTVIHEIGHFFGLEDDEMPF
ncbi:MAG: metallopeptidase family protein [Thermoanaerobaculia bacterium]